MPATPPPAAVGQVFEKETLVKGRAATIRCVSLGEQVFTIDPGLVSVIHLEDEWFEDLHDPERVLQLIRAVPGARADLLSFWQRMPDVTRRFPYHVEFEEIAVLPIESYDKWWKSQIKSRVRNQVRKSEKDGVVVKEVPYDDAFVRGMTEIFNEAPVRQGRKFWHYGKDFETIKHQFSRYVHREYMIGAYLGDRMIGFMMLGNAGHFALTGQIISSLEDRDKSPNNALIAKAVEICAQRGLPYLIYLFWSDDTLAEFKRRCGFERVVVPRYYVPLSRKGELALRWGMHLGWKAMMPQGLKRSLKRVRGSWYGFRGH
jgi:hypothetical protein